MLDGRWCGAHADRWATWCESGITLFSCFSHLACIPGRVLLKGLRYFGGLLHKYALVLERQIWDAYNHPANHPPG